MMHYHQVTGHASQDYVFSNVKQKFWITKGRSVEQESSEADSAAEGGMQHMVNRSWHTYQRIAWCQINHNLSMWVLIFWTFLTSWTQSKKEIQMPLHLFDSQSCAHWGRPPSADWLFYQGLAEIYMLSWIPRGNSQQQWDKPRWWWVRATKGHRRMESTQDKWLLSERGITWVFNPSLASHMGIIWECQIIIIIIIIIMVYLTDP